MSLQERIVGAFTFKREAYRDVKDDPSFTPTAWGIVVVVNLINQFAGFLTAGIAATALTNSLFGDNAAVGAAAVAGGSLVAVVLQTIIGVAGFAIAALAVMLVANTLFEAKTTFDQMVRTLGLAYVWSVVGILSLLLVVSPSLICLVGSLSLLGGLLFALAAAIGVKETTGFDWVKTIVTIVIAVVVQLIAIAILGSLFVGVLGNAVGF